LSNSNNQLTQLTFVNAASLPYAHVDIDGNTLFSGRNGAGKTTILRAVLYFYGAYRSEALGISRKKKRFEDYYFTRSNSYLVYRFSNDFGNVLAVVYRSSGVKVKYRFIKEPSDVEVTESLLQEIFFKDGVAKESKELFNSFLGKNFELSPVISSSKEYKNILYGQDRRLISYSFFQANAEYDQIAKTISNIFVNSKLDSGSIKKSLASSITGFSPIDLNQMEQMIEGFKEQYEDIKNFQKHESTIIEAIGSLSELQEHNEKISSSLGQLQANKSSREDILIDAKQSYTLKQEALSASEKNFKEEESLYIEAKDDFLRSSAVLEAHIKSVKDKELFYEQQNISEKLKAYASLDSISEQIRAVEKQKGLLTQKFTSITEQFESLKNEENQSFLKQKQSCVEQINSIEQEFNEKYRVLMQNQQQGLESFDREKSEHIESLRSKLTNAKEHYQKQAYSLERLQQEPFLQQELQIAIEARRFTHESMQNLHNQMNMAKKDLEIIFSQVSQKEQILAQNLQSNRERYLRTKEDLQKSLSDIEAKVEHFEHSLFGFIKSEQLPHEKKLLKVLKEDVLFSSGLTPKVLSGDALLGLDINYDMLQEVDFDIVALKQERESLLNKLDELNKSYEQKKEQDENDTRNAINALKRQEQTLRQNLDGFAMELPKLERASLESQEAVARIEKDASIQKAEAIVNMQEELDVAQQHFHDSQRFFEDASNSMKAEREQLQAKTTEHKDEILLHKQESKAALEAKLQSLQATIDEKLASLKVQEEQVFEDGGIDTSLLASFEAEIATLENERNSIKLFEDMVKEYEIDNKRLFSNFSDKQEELETLKEHYNKQTHSFTTNKYEHDESYKEANKSLTHLKRQVEKLKSELNSFETFMNSSFGEALELVVQNDIEANDESLKDLIEIVKEASFAKEKASSNLSKKLRRVFDKLSINSSFNIERPSSEDEVEMIRAARALESFVLDNKIDTFKAEVSRLYGTTLHHIASETSDLLKAEDEIKKTVSHINKTLSDLQGIKVIEKIELKFRNSDNPILNLLTVIGELNQEMPYGNDNLFSQSSDKKYHKEVLSTLVDLSRALDQEKNDLLSVEDSFVLEFRAIENGHDTGFVSSLDGIGSNGTDVMVKAMVYIAMLSLAREQSSKADSEVFFHCILDEVGILAPNYLKELINYANAKQIRFLNGAPDEKLVTTYKRLYMLSTNTKHQTMVRRLLAQV
jgi:hypothetical protein